MKQVAVLLLCLLWGSGRILAQETTAEPAPLATIPANYEAILEEMDKRVEQVDRGVNFATSLLNIFDGIALILTVGGVILGVFGVASLRESQQTNRKLQEEARALTDKFNAEIKKREDELDLLRNKIEQSAHLVTLEVQKRTDNALVAASLIALAERQYRASDYDGALDVYRRALELDPDNPIINQRLGYVYIQIGDVFKSREHYEFSLKHTPDLAQSLAGLGFVMRREAEMLPEGVEQDMLYNQAEQYLLKALRISHNLVDDDGESWWGVLGGLYRRRGYVDQAIRSYDEATKVTPQSSYGYGNLALLYMKKNDHGKMEQMYRKMEKIAVSESLSSSGNFWGYADLIVSRFALGYHEKAEEDLPIALRIAPKDADWMLEGLRDTLSDLADHVDTSRVMPIRNAISNIQVALEARAAERHTNENQGIAL